MALVLTPAPDLEAVREKIGVIRAHQLHELESMTHDCFEVLEEDVTQAAQALSLRSPQVSSCGRD